jgi:uncharacterized membrane-anchored protein YitT (DUF2179 family)
LLTILPRYKELTDKNMILNLIGISLMNLALKGLMIPIKFLDAGFTDCSILLNEVTHISFVLPVIIINLPLSFLGAKNY